MECQSFFWEGKKMSRQILNFVIFSKISNENIWHTVKQFNFVGNLILQNSWKTQICEIKLMWNCKFYIYSNSKFSIFVKLSAHKNNNDFQYTKNKVFTKLTLRCFTVYIYTEHSWYVYLIFKLVLSSLSISFFIYSISSIHAPWGWYDTWYCIVFIVSYHYNTAGCLVRF